ncbi:unnamed protein product [Symbiodinium sp. CCMP2592]|nr:unnamed protein product [Symbiodinium sp. CCMP2592]
MAAASAETGVMGSDGSGTDAAESSGTGSTSGASSDSDNRPLVPRPKPKPNPAASVPSRNNAEGAEEDNDEGSSPEAADSGDDGDESSQVSALSMGLIEEFEDGDQDCEDDRSDRDEKVDVPDLKETDDGSSDFAHLCAWPRNNCERLFACEKKGQAYKATASDIYSNYDFSQSWRDTCEITQIAIENDAVTQKVIMNLHKDMREMDYRPQHLIGDMDEMVTLSARARLDEAFHQTSQEYELDISCDDTAEAVMLSETGHKLMERYMQVLQNRASMRACADCIKCNAERSANAAPPAKRSKKQQTQTTQQSQLEKTLLPEKDGYRQGYGKDWSWFGLVLAVCVCAWACAWAWAWAGWLQRSDGCFGI